jgi:hypothetical protein
MLTTVLVVLAAMEAYPAFAVSGFKACLHAYTLLALPSTYVLFCCKPKPPVTLDALL